MANIHAKKTMLDVQVFRGYDIGSDHHLVEAAIRVNNIGKTTECRQMQLNINSLNDSVTNWLYKRRMEIIEKDSPIEEGVEKEWVCLKTIVHESSRGGTRKKIK